MLQRAVDWTIDYRLGKENTQRPLFEFLYYPSFHPGLDYGFIRIASDVSLHYTIPREVSILDTWAAIPTHVTNKMAASIASRFCYDNATAASQYGGPHIPTWQSTIYLIVYCNETSGVPNVYGHSNRDASR